MTGPRPFHSRPCPTITSFRDGDTFVPPSRSDAHLPGPLHRGFWDTRNTRRRWPGSTLTQQGSVLLPTGRLVTAATARFAHPHLRRISAGDL